MWSKHCRIIGRWSNRFTIRCRWLSQSSQVLVFFAIQHIHIPCWPAYRATMACIRVHLLPQGAGFGTQRSQAKGAEGVTQQTGVRGNIYDRSKRLGWRAYLGSNNNWSNFGKYTYYSLVFPLSLSLVSLVKVSHAFFIALYYDFHSLRSVWQLRVECSICHNFIVPHFVACLLFMFVGCMSTTEATQ